MEWVRTPQIKMVIALDIGKYKEMSTLAQEL